MKKNNVQDNDNYDVLLYVGGMYGFFRLIVDTITIVMGYVSKIN